MDININEIFHDQITKLSSSFIPPGFKGNVRSIRIMQDYLAKLIDFLGEQSTKAQGLSKVITTSEKFRDSSEQMLYLLKDAEANDGKGEIIGMLKMGRKHLFLFDEREFLEVEPLCVLDFFVLRDRQRLGYGKLLFDYMLHDLNIQAYELAVDGPSPKMIAFLMKNYGVGRMIRQNNNFAVAPQFFNNRDQFISRSGHTAPVVSATDSRCAIGLTKPTSAIASIIHGGDSYVPEPKSGGVSGRTTPEECLVERGPLTLPEFGRSYYETELRVVVEPEAQAPAGSHSGPLSGLLTGPPSGPLSGPPSGSPSRPLPGRTPERPTTLPGPLSGRTPERPTTLPGPLSGSPLGRTPERPTTLLVDTTRPAGMPTPGSTSRRMSSMNGQGFFDIKFYHNKLW